MRNYIWIKILAGSYSLIKTCVKTCLDWHAAFFLFTTIVPTPKNDLIRYNVAISLLCNCIAKAACTLQPTHRALFFVIDITNVPSAYVNPVTQIPPPLVGTGLRRVYDNFPSKIWMPLILEFLTAIKWRTSYFYNH